MTLYQFNALDEMEQAEAVWNGVFLGDRRESEHRILLYQIDAFYVEVYYHLEYNTLRRFRSFSSCDQLDPYLTQIDLTGKF